MRRYTHLDVTANRFYQMPQFLFAGDMKKLSNDARVLYSLMRNRHELSLKNHWLNQNNEVYIIFSREDMADMLGCSQPTLRKTLKELDKAQLLEEERQGMNLPNLIYLKYIDVVPGEAPPHAPEKEEVSEVADIPETTPAELEVPQIGAEIPDEPLECKNLSVRTEKNLHSGVKESFSPDCKNLSPNKTNINKTEISNNQSIYQLMTPQEFDEEVKAQIQYESLLMDGYDRNYLFSIVEITKDLLLHPPETVRINGRDVAGNVLIGSLIQLERDHIAFVLDSLSAVQGVIHNPRNYIISALYNARITLDLQLLQLPKSP